MKLKKSVHYKDALVQTSSNAAGIGAMEVLKLYSKKWRICKTIVFIRPNGLVNTAYVDTEGRCVYITLPGVPGRWETIGERIESKDPIELI